MKKDELLVPRLDFLIPMSWWELWDTAHLDKASALGRIVEINPDWVIEVVNNEHRLEDVLHDFRGILDEDEHFVPRISTSTDESVHSQLETINHLVKKENNNTMYKAMVKESQEFWGKVASENGWNMDGRGCTIWINEDNEVLDSVYNKEGNKESYIVQDEVLIKTI